MSMIIVPTGKPVKYKPKGRHCQWRKCNAKMSIYNLDNKYCFVHQRVADDFKHKRRKQVKRRSNELCSD